jgi:hypothetical protein
MHPMTEFGKPFRVHARPPTDIEDVARVVREVPEHDLFRALELEGAGRESAAQALGFLSSFVVRADGRV